MSKLFYSSENVRLRKYYKDINQTQRNIERDIKLNKILLDEKLFEDFIKNNTSKTQLPKIDKPIITSDLSTPSAFYKKQITLLPENEEKPNRSPKQDLSPLITELKGKLSSPKLGLRISQPVSPISLSSTTNATLGEKSSPKTIANEYQQLKTQAKQIKDYIKVNYVANNLAKGSSGQKKEDLISYLEKVKFDSQLNKDEILMNMINPQEETLSSPSYDLGVLSQGSGLRQKKYIFHKYRSLIAY
jgi:hypothetical protein